MEQYLSEVASELLLDEIRKITLERIPDGSGSGHHGGPESWIYGLANARITPLGGTSIDAAIRSLARGTGHVGARPAQVMVNRLRIGGRLEPHMDGPPDHLRYHLPVKTGVGAYWWDEINGKVVMEQGLWYGPVPYCGKMHAFYNESGVERIHIVVDYRR